MMHHVLYYQQIPRLLKSKNALQQSKLHISLVLSHQLFYHVVTDVPLVPPETNFTHQLKITKTYLDDLSNVRMSNQVLYCQEIVQISLRNRTFTWRMLTRWIPSIPIINLCKSIRIATVVCSLWFRPRRQRLSDIRIGRNCWRRQQGLRVNIIRLAILFRRFESCRKAHRSRTRRFFW